MSNHPALRGSAAPAPIDLDAVNDPATRMWIVDPDERMAELGRRVQGQYPGAAVTAAGVRAIRADWKPRRRSIRQFLGNLAVILNSAFAVWAVGMVALLSTGILR